MIDNFTKIYGLLGRDIKYSLSPLIHNYIFEQSGFNGVYLLFDMENKQLKRGIDALKTIEIKGFNVTKPFKEEILLYLNEINSEVEILQSVNTVIYRKNQFLGLNTDVSGFEKAMIRNNINLDNEKLLILGNGGAAKALILGLLMRHENLKIILIGRDINKSLKIKSLAEEKFENSEIIIDNFENINKYIYLVTLIINCTPVGGPGYENEMIINEKYLRKNLKIVDLNYIVKHSILRKTCENKGLFYLDGLDMLIYQAVESQKIWTGLEIDFEIIKKFIEKERDKLCWNIV